MLTRSRHLLSCSAGAALMLAATAFASDTVLIHGHIYTENPQAPWAEALAITKGRIVAVGSDADVLKQKDAKTRVIDLQGRTVIPGIIDIHEHVLYGGMAIHGFNLSTPEFNITPADEMPSWTRSRCMQPAIQTRKCCLDELRFRSRLIRRRNWSYSIGRFPIVPW